MFLAAAARETQSIRLGTGVVSLPYHHPFNVAERLVLLDHLSKGRAMLGVGPGALSSDASMQGIDPVQMRPRMEEALAAVVALLRSEDPVNQKTDWFELVDARLNLRSYQWPHMEIAVAGTVSPNGPRNAGRFGAGLLSLSASTEDGSAVLGEHWEIWHSEAREHGQKADRNAWRLVAPVHVAETREQALRDVEYGIAHWIDYFTTIVQIPGAPDTTDPVAYTNWLIESGTAAIGTPGDLIAMIERLRSQSNGFGCFLAMAHDWASPDATRRSYELIASEVFPSFQGSADRANRSHTWAQGQAPAFVERQMLAGQEARDRHAREVAERAKRGTS